MSEERTLSEYERELVSNVEQYGCQVTTVFDPDGIEPTFSYSVGVPKSVGQPDLIVFGLPSEISNWIVNETFRKCRSGLQLTDGLQIDGLLDGHQCVSRRVRDAWLKPDFFNSALWFHRNFGVGEWPGAFQIVWPGAQDGLFPWDDGCSQIVIDHQPALYEEPA